VFLLGKVYEAPVALIEKRVALLYHVKDPGRIEIVYNGSSYGFLVPLNPHVNIRLKRTQLKTLQVLPQEEQHKVQRVEQDNAPEYKSGALFEHGEQFDAEL